MVRTITVKGIGNATTKPDYVVVTMALVSRDMNYDRAMAKGSLRIQALTETLHGVGFESAEVKTTNFDIRTQYRNCKDQNGNYRKEFDGYAINQTVKVSFDFDSRRLSEILAAITGCMSQPNLNIRFTVKDATAINEEMLRSATANAKRKAQILCDASGARLGALLSINYNWGELEIFSHTDYCLEEEGKCLAPASIEIEPDDIETSDSATFVWEIL